MRKRINSSVEQGNIRILYIGIISVSVEIKWLKWKRKAHYDFINHTIGNRLTEQPKSFWSYIKLMRTENIGITTHELKQNYVPLIKRKQIH